MNLKETFKALGEGKAIRVPKWSRDTYLIIINDKLVDENGNEFHFDFNAFLDYQIYDRNFVIKTKIKELKSELKKLEKQLSEN